MANQPSHSLYTQILRLRFGMQFLAADKDYLHREEKNYWETKK
jgi:hypothetical protein